MSDIKPVAQFHVVTFRLAYNCGEVKMATVNIPLDDETAKIYQKAPSADKKKMQLLLSLWLREFEKPSITLDKLMDDVSRKAQERGLTPEILDSILYD